MTRLRTLAVASSLAVLLGCGGDNNLADRNNLTDRTREALARKAELKRIDEKIATYTKPAEATTPPTPPSVLTYTGKIFRIIPNTKNPAEYTIVFWDGRCAYDSGAITPGTPDWMRPYLQEQRHALAIASIPKHRDVVVGYRATWPSTGCVDMESISVPAWKKK